jgi:uncharacterized DUF497 family protein
MVKNVGRPLEKKGVLMLLVAHTIFDEDDCEIIRIISARQVTKAERDKYEHG